MGNEFAKSCKSSEAGDDLEVSWRWSSVIGQSLYTPERAKRAEDLLR
jgi:hypothetical protein